MRLSPLFFMPGRRPLRKNSGAFPPAPLPRPPARRRRSAISRTRSQLPQDRADGHGRRVHAVLRKFRIVFNSSVRHSRWVESHCGVSAPQLWALSELAKRPGLRVADLARTMSLHVSTASNLLDKLEQRRLIERVRDRADQRVVRLFATDAGLRLLKDAPGPAMSLLPESLYKLPDKVLEDLDRAMTRLVANLGVKDERAGYEPIKLP